MQGLGQQDYQQQNQPYQQQQQNPQNQNYQPQNQGYQQQGAGFGPQGQQFQQQQPQQQQQQQPNQPYSQQNQGSSMQGNQGTSKPMRGIPTVLPTPQAKAQPNTTQGQQQQQQQQQQQSTGPNLMQKFTEMAGASAGGDILSKGKELIFMKFGLGKWVITLLVSPAPLLLHFCPIALSIGWVYAESSRGRKVGRL